LYTINIVLPADFNQLISNLPQQGRVEWIGVRPGKRQDMHILTSVEVLPSGLEGDHYAGSNGKRSITLIQHEHFASIASLLNINNVQPEQLRRNLVISGLNLLALKQQAFHVGTALLEMTGLCHPCSRMEDTFGNGGYNAVRGHGGITARVLVPGIIQLGDPVRIHTRKKI
jgi:MOSC domain-containing protein YiiM